MLETQLNLLEDDISELIISENANAVYAYFDKRELESFTRLVNAFQYGKTTHSIDNQKDKQAELTICIYQDGTKIALSLSGQQNHFLTSFTKKQWDQFKARVNKGPDPV